MTDLSEWGHEQGSPSNLKESDLIKELTPEDAFYSSEVEVPEHALVYINHLEKSNKAMRLEVKQLLDIYSTFKDQTFICNKFRDILKM